MAGGATTLLRTEHTPDLPPGFEGVRIALAPRPQRLSPAVVCGAYFLPWPDAEKIAPSRHRAIVLVVSRGPPWLVATPFREQILFEDDERPARAGVSGHFTIDLTALTDGKLFSGFRAFVSLGP